MDFDIFKMIIEEETTKDSWEKLKSLYGGDEKLKKVKLQTLRKQYEMIHMKEDESVSAYFSRIMTLTNQMKACGESVTAQQKI